MLRRGPSGGWSSPPTPGTGTHGLVLRPAPREPDLPTHHPTPLKGELSSFSPRTHHPTFDGTLGPPLHVDPSGPAGTSVSYHWRDAA